MMNHATEPDIKTTENIIFARSLTFIPHRLRKIHRHPAFPVSDIGRNPENSAAYILTEVGKYVDSVMPKDDFLRRNP
jgi:hypothetical protein